MLFNNLSGSYSNEGTLGNVLYKNYDKHVSLDLSGSTFYENRISESAFFGGGLVNIILPSGVTEIGQNAFGYCFYLASITIPNSVTSIGKYAFDDCYRLTSIIIPNSVTSIGEGAFSVCDSLTSVTFQGTIPADNFVDSAFEGNLRDVFYAIDPVNGTPGTYTTTRTPDVCCCDTEWTLQP